jgi:type II secretory pathway pseudopilin PulG
MEKTKRKIKIEKNSERAFTLVEVMFGITIFALALFGVMMTLGYSLTMSSFANNRAIAMNKAQQIIEALRREADTNGLTSAVNRANTNTPNYWETFTSQNLDGTQNTLENERIFVEDPDGGQVNNTNPAEIRVRITWNEKGKNTIHAVDTMVTDR